MSTQFYHNYKVKFLDYILFFDNYIIQFLFSFSLIILVYYVLLKFLKLFLHFA